MVRFCMDSKGLGLGMFWVQNIVQFVFEQVEGKVDDQNGDVWYGGQLLCVQQILLFLCCYCVLFWYWWLCIKVQKVKFGCCQDD